MTDFARPDGRAVEALRPVSFQRDIAPHASGSVLVSFGDTRVICAATLDTDIPKWKRGEENPSGWLTAEYSMLPYSTLDRKKRDIAKGKQDGRSVEIQRLIGRSLRAVCDLAKLPGYTIWLDCDVLQADGGTRTASITGAYVAAEMAIQQAIKDGLLTESPFTDSVAAVSVGVWEGTPICDLCYLEDKDASVDANLVMTGSGRFVEVQASGEEATFSDDELAELLRLGRSGINELTRLQKAVLAEV